MAEHGTSTTSESAEDAAFLKDREAMFGGFISMTTYSILGVIAVLVLMAIFLL